MEPQLFHVKDLDTNDPKVAVHIIGCTNDWFGGWDGLTRGNADLLISEDLSGGRLVEVIARQEPAFIVCHWPGVYFNGEKTGFNIFKQVVSRLHGRYDNLIWMKQGDVARYWAAKKLTGIETGKNSIKLTAPFATNWFTLSVSGKFRSAKVMNDGKTYMLNPASDPLGLDNGKIFADRKESLLCFKLEKGITTIELN